MDIREEINWKEAYGNFTKGGISSLNGPTLESLRRGVILGWTRFAFENGFESGLKLLRSSVSLASVVMPEETVPALILRLKQRVTYDEFDRKHNIIINVMGLQCVLMSLVVMFLSFPLCCKWLKSSYRNFVKKEPKVLPEKILSESKNEELLYMFRTQLQKYENEFQDHVKRMSKMEERKSPRCLCLRLTKLFWPSRQSRKRHKATTRKTSEDIWDPRRICSQLSSREFEKKKKRVVNEHLDIFRTKRPKTTKSMFLLRRK